MFAVINYQHVGEIMRMLMVALKKLIKVAISCPSLLLESVVQRSKF